MRHVTDVDITPTEIGPALVSGPLYRTAETARTSPRPHEIQPLSALRQRGRLHQYPPKHRLRRTGHAATTSGSDSVLTGETKVPVGYRPLGPFWVSPIGFGAMRLAGPNAFGPAKDRSEALAVLRRAVDCGVNHIDTAQFYGPTVVNELIREALHPYPDELILVSKVGARRDRHRGILIDDAPHRLRRGIEENLRTLDVDVLPVVNLQLMRATGPNGLFDDQLDAMVSARDDGLIKAIGLGNITRPHLLHALRFTEVACVQNAFHLMNRKSQAVLAECTRRQIAFVPFAALGAYDRPQFGSRRPRTGPAGGAPGPQPGADRLGLDPGGLPQRRAYTRHILPGALAGKFGRLGRPP
jgi:pyridoxine 4-dehydrogenase